MPWTFWRARTSLPPGGPDFNMCNLVCGSAGTLCFVTDAKLNLVPALPPVVGVMTMHFTNVADSLKANLVALDKPTACELIGDFYIRQALENNAVNSTNIIARCSQWIQGKPHDHREIYEVLDLCISCKGCKSECPASVDWRSLRPSSSTLARRPPAGPAHPRHRQFRDADAAGYAGLRRSSICWRAIR
jgi:ferredoxin